MKLNWADADVIERKYKDVLEEMSKTYTLYSEFNELISFDLFKFSLFLIYEKYKNKLNTYTKALEFSETILRIYLISLELQYSKYAILYDDNELIVLFNIKKNTLKLKLMIEFDPSDIEEIVLKHD